LLIWKLVDFQNSESTLESRMLIEAV
jgi:hypothetical protein